MEDRAGFEPAYEGLLGLPPDHSVTGPLSLTAGGGSLLRRHPTGLTRNTARDGALAT